MKRKKLTERNINRIRKNPNSQNWEFISVHLKLSEPFIKEFKDKVDWFYISIHQKLSEPFIKEFYNKVYWYQILLYQNYQNHL